MKRDKIEKETQKLEKRIYLIRHGITEANEKMLFCGQTDVPLSARGRAELDALRQQGGYPDLRGLRIYTSGLKRTEETLELLFGAVDHEMDGELKEMNFGEFEMLTYEQMARIPSCADWLADMGGEIPCPGGESGRQMEARILAEFKRLVALDGDALLLIHGGPISSIMTNLFPDEPKTRWDWQPKNGRGYLLTLNGDQFTYESVPAASC